MLKGVRRSNGTNNWIPQSSFNVDLLDGTGNTNNPSNFLINPQKFLLLNKMKK